MVLATSSANGPSSRADPGRRCRNILHSRTGATIYYVEMIPAVPGRTPVLSLMPAPGDVDIVIAAELMEAGRAIQRGLVSPDRTTLIASTHRALGILEKTAPGDGISDSAIHAVARNMDCVIGIPDAYVTGATKG